MQCAQLGPRGVCSGLFLLQKQRVELERSGVAFALRVSLCFAANVYYVQKHFDESVTKRRVADCYSLLLTASWASLG